MYSHNHASDASGKCLQHLAEEYDRMTSEAYVGTICKPVKSNSGLRETSASVGAGLSDDAHTDLEAVDKILTRTLVNVRKIRNARQSIMRLPAEVLVMIFQHLQPPWHFLGDIEHCYPSYKLADGTWTRVLHVCSHWRAIGLRSSILWNTITLESQNLKESFARESLLRSSGRQLNVYIHFGLNAYPRNVYQEVLAQFSRIRLLYLYNIPMEEVDADPLARRQLKRGFYLPADSDVTSSLDTLIFAEIPSGCGERQRGWSYLSRFVSHVPSLKFLRVTGIRVLKCLGSLQNLRQLEIQQREYVIRDDSDFSAFLDVLENNRELEDLALLEMRLAYCVKATSRHVDMPALRRLRIAAMCMYDIQRLLSCLRLHDQLAVSMTEMDIMSQNIWRIFSPRESTYNKMLPVDVLRLKIHHDFNNVGDGLGVTGVNDSCAWNIERCALPDALKDLACLRVAEDVKELRLEPPMTCERDLDYRPSPQSSHYHSSLYEANYGARLGALKQFLLGAKNLQKLIVNSSTNTARCEAQEDQDIRLEWLVRFLSFSFEQSQCYNLKIIEIHGFSEGLVERILDFIIQLKSLVTPVMPVLNLFMRQGYDSNSAAMKHFRDSDAFKTLSNHVQCTVYASEEAHRMRYNSRIRYPQACLSRKCEGGRWDWPEWT